MRFIIVALCGLCSAGLSGCADDDAVSAISISLNSSDDIWLSGVSNVVSISVSDPSNAGVYGVKCSYKDEDGSYHTIGEADNTLSAEFWTSVIPPANAGSDYTIRLYGYALNDYGAELEREKGPRINVRDAVSIDHFLSLSTSSTNTVLTNRFEKVAAYRVQLSGLSSLLHFSLSPQSGFDPVIRCIGTDGTLLATINSNGINGGEDGTCDVSGPVGYLQIWGNTYTGLYSISISAAP